MLQFMAQESLKLILGFLSYQNDVHVKVWPVVLLGKYFDQHCIYFINIKDMILVR